MNVENQEIHLALPKPDFDGGNFTIEFLATDARGLQVKTGKSLPRFDENNPYSLTDEEKAKVRANYPGQMRFTQGSLAQEALGKIRSLGDNATEDEYQAALSEYNDARLNYLRRSPTGMGIRHLRREGDMVVIDTKPVNYPAYRAFGGAENRSELHEFAANSAVTMHIIFP